MPANDLPRVVENVTKVPGDEIVKVCLQQQLEPPLSLLAPLPFYLIVWVGSFHVDCWSHRDNYSIVQFAKVFSVPHYSIYTVGLLIATVSG